VNSLEGGPYLGVDEVAELLVVSQWAIYDRSRRGAIPHRKPPGSRKLLFLVEEIRAWVDGAELESTTPPAWSCLPAGGVPVTAALYTKGGSVSE
jgi:predicted DNA-binding transcriptional regulator AlpA